MLRELLIAFGGLAGALIFAVGIVRYADWRHRQAAIRDVQRRAYERDELAERRRDQQAAREQQDRVRVRRGPQF